MVLFDEDPVTLISQTTQNFHTHHDLASLERISTSIATLRSARAMRLAAQRSSAAGTARRLANAQAAHNDALIGRDPAAHDEEVLRLDALRFKAAKGVSDARAEGDRREGEIRALQRVLEGLAGREDEGEAGSEVLRLRVYRGLGMDAELGETEGGRVVVRNKAGGDVNVVRLEDGWDRGFYARHLWGCL